MLAEIVDLRLQLLPHAICLLGEKGLFAVDCVEEFVLFAVHEGSGLQDGLLHVLDLDLVLGAENLDLVLEFLDEAGESGDFEALFVVGCGQFVLLVLAGLLELLELLVEVINLSVEFVPLIVPIRGLPLLSGEPVAVLLLLPVELLLQFFDVALVEAKHLLDLEVEGLDFLVLALDLALESALFVHDLLVVEVPGLEKLVVGDVGE